MDKRNDPPKKDKKENKTNNATPSVDVMTGHTKNKNKQKRLTQADNHSTEDHPGGRSMAGCLDAFVWVVYLVTLVSRVKLDKIAASFGVLILSALIPRITVVKLAASFGNYILHASPPRVKVVSRLPLRGIVFYMPRLRELKL